MDKLGRFRALHIPGSPLLMPNPWDAVSARLLASLGFQALASTSSGHAGTLGLPDGSIDKATALRHAGELAAAISVGGAFSRVALGAVSRAGRELLEHGTHGFLELAAQGDSQIRTALRPR